MPTRPNVVAFDIIETTFSLEPLRDRLSALGLPGGSLETWFAVGLRDAFALAAAGDFAPFRSVLEGALGQVLAEHQVQISGEQRSGVLDMMSRLPPHPDAATAFQTLARAGVRIMALSNGAATATETLLDRAGLAGFVEWIVSVDDVGFSKPRPEVYRHAVRTAGVAAEEMTLVATHSWDVHGAKAAGLKAAYVRRGRPFPQTMRAPDLEGEELADVARRLVSVLGGGWA